MAECHVLLERDAFTISAGRTKAPQYLTYRTNARAGAEEETPDIKLLCYGDEAPNRAEV